MIENLQIFVFAAGGAVSLIIFVLWRVFASRRRQFSSTEGNQSQQELLAKLEKTVKGQEKQIAALKVKIGLLEKLAKSSFQKAGVVRYNPFQQVGGDQSFSVALLDGGNSGFVITSLFMKENNRIFVKPIKQGKSDYSLSDEEKTAISRAEGGG
jgi:hypothetical protein